MISLCLLTVAALLAPPAPAQRPRDPWVFRLVLDEKPRIITVALHEDLWLAYDGTDCGLYLAWKGDVRLEGAVFTTVHGPQPTSRGIVYHRRPHEPAWTVHQGNVELPATAVYQGHLIADGHVTLRYDLLLADGRRIGVQETPEFAMTDDGRTALSRTWQVLDIPGGTTVRLALRGSERDARWSIDGVATGSGGRKTIPKARECELIWDRDGKTDVTVAWEAEEVPREPGVSVRLYAVGEWMDRLLPLVPGQTPNISKVVPRIDLHTKMDDFAPLEGGFLTHIEGYLSIHTPGVYAFRLISDDGSDFDFGDVKVIDHDGLHSTTARDGTIELQTGTHPFRLRHFEGGGGADLTLLWKPPGAAAEAEFEIVPAAVLSCRAGEVRVTSPGEKKIMRPLQRGRPGDGQPLDGVHPSFDLVTLRPQEFEPRVGGMDWLSDGRLVICTWDDVGRVYILDGVQGRDPQNVKVQLFAAGLAEPLGLKVVDDQVYVLQKQELTQLLDHNQDGVADEYRCVCGGWPVTANFHEFAFGLAYKENHFFANLAVAINPGGKTTVPQVFGRGTVLKIAKDGTYEFFAGGLRTPNGIGLGVDGELFVTDNQGDWLPCSKLLHVRDGRFFNSRLTPPGPFSDQPVTPPVVWLPQGEIGNSPGQPALVPDGIFKGQMMHSDITHGGVKRVFVEKVAGEYQGCVFRFTQGLEAGINRISWGPDGALYVGGIGSTGNWGQEGKKWFGLQKLVPNGKPTFEMLAVRAKSNGMEIEFTEPCGTGILPVSSIPSSTGILPVNSGTPAQTGVSAWRQEFYHVRQWRYEPTAEYGGPKIDEQTMLVRSASVSSDHRKVFLEIDGLKPGYVAYIRLLGRFLAESGRPLWSTEGWYTLNAIPENEPGTIQPAPPAPPSNVLTNAEKAAGWMLLFDGNTTKGWRSFRKQAVPDGWQVQDGCLVRIADAGDLITEQQFDNFELFFEWRISEGGNSGLFFRVSGDFDYVWQTGPEYQILDNDRHPDGQNPKTSAGANYALHAPPSDLTMPVGVFNQSRIIVDGNRAEYWLNDTKTCEYELGSSEWQELVAASKFKDMPSYARTPRGHIALQDHGDRVEFRNIKLRKL